jgi:hypothetical protein
VHELQLGGDALVDVERRRQVGGDGVLGQDPLGEPVQRRDDGLVDARRGSLAADPAGVAQVRWAGRVGGELQGGADAVAQFGSGGLGEGDGGELADVGQVAVGDQADDSAHERRRLAGAGAGLDEQVAVQVALDRRAGVLVEREVDAHDGASGAGGSGSARSR